jgi:hypothetical protein
VVTQARHLAWRYEQSQKDALLDSASAEGVVGSPERARSVDQYFWQPDDVSTEIQVGLTI